MALSLEEVLQKRLTFEAEYHKEAMAAIKAALDKLFDDHPIIQKTEWVHGDFYNDETYDFKFSGLKFLLEQPFHAAIRRNEYYKDDEMFLIGLDYPGATPVIWDESEKPEAYTGDPRIGPAITALRSLNDRFRALATELVTIFSTPDEQCNKITATPGNLNVRKWYP